MNSSSNRQKKIEKRKEIQAHTILSKKRQEAENRWTNAQIQAAGFQSILNYAVEQYTKHKEELEEDIITQTEQNIKERQLEIEKFLMSEKDVYLECMGIQAD